VLVREIAICAGQAVADGNLAGVRGRIRGYRAAPRSEAYPAGAVPDPPSLLTTLRRRVRRRAMLRRRNE
jgi:hypothetical protein